jgi:hypothetical protein
MDVRFTPESGHWRGHSITSSAVASTDCGMFRPSALARRIARNIAKLPELLRKAWFSFRLGVRKRNNAEAEFVFWTQNIESAYFDFGFGR